MGRDDGDASVLRSVSPPIFRLAGLVLVLVLAAPAASQLTCEHSRYDFGRQPQMTDHAGRFVLVNEGSVPVAIRSVRFRCFCAKGRAKDRVVPAGGSTTLDFTFNTMSFEGPVRKPVLVRYGHPARTLALSIGGVVVPTWSVETRDLHVGGVLPGQIVEREVTVLPAAEGGAVAAPADLDVTVSTQSRMLTVIREALPAPERGWRVKIRLAVPAKAAAGRIHEIVELRANDPKKAKDTIRVSGQIEADLKVSPRHLAMGRVRSDQEVRRRVVIDSRSKSPFRIVQVRDDPVLLVEAEVGKPKARHEVVVVVPKGARPGAWRGTVALRTDSPAEPIVAITYSFRVEGP